MFTPQCHALLSLSLSPSLLSDSLSFTPQNMAFRRQREEMAQPAARLPPARVAPARADAAPPRNRQATDAVLTVTQLAAMHVEAGITDINAALMSLPTSTATARQLLSALDPSLLPGMKRACCDALLWCGRDPVPVLPPLPIDATQAVVNACAATLLEVFGAPETAAVSQLRGVAQPFVLARANGRVPPSLLHLLRPEAASDLNAALEEARQRALGRAPAAAISVLKAEAPLPADALSMFAVSSVAISILAPTLASMLTGMTRGRSGRQVSLGVATAIMWADDEGEAWFAAQ